MTWEVRHDALTVRSCVACGWPASVLRPDEIFHTFPDRVACPDCQAPLTVHEIPAGVIRSWHKTAAERDRYREALKQLLADAEGWQRAVDAEFTVFDYGETPKSIEDARVVLSRSGDAA